jgi:hypothetical protein
LQWPHVILISCKLKGACGTVCMQLQCNAATTT